MAQAPVVSAQTLLDNLGIPAQSTSQALAGAAAPASDAAGAAAASASGHEEDVDPGESATERDLRELFAARRPLRPVILGASAPVLQRSLNAELTCPVCLGIIRDCTAVMECLHRFCAACIEKSLRFGKKECPSCRVTVASRRNLRKDEAFSAVIAAIYPDLAQAEAAHENYIQDVIRSYNFGTIASRGSRQQKDHARKSAKRPASPPPSGFDSSYSGAMLPVAKRACNPNKPEPISFSLVQHPELSASPLGPTYQLHKKFVRTSRYVTTLLLKKWLQLKLLTPKSEAAKVEEGGVKAEGGDAASAAAAAAAAPVKSESTAAAGAASPSAPPPPVRFVLYVRAFDTQLLEPESIVSVGGGGAGGMPAGKELFVPLASDLTLDYIEEHMWNSEGRIAANEAAAIQSAMNASGTTDPTQVLKRMFAQSFVQCSSHRKQNAPCPEDCTDRMAAWHVYFAKEKEKLDKWQQQQQQQQLHAITHAANGVTQTATAANPLPHKKKRLVIYYSVVGADGQLLLQAPVLAPEVVAKFIVQPEKDEDEEGESGAGAGAGAGAAAGAQTPMDTTAGQTQPSDQQAQQAAQPEEPTPMQMDDASASDASAGALPTVPAA